MGNEKKKEKKRKRKGKEKEKKRKRKGKEKLNIINAITANRKCISLVLLHRDNLQ